MKIFMHNGEPYMRVYPSKRLFNSTMVWEVVNRGDFFAVNMLTGVFTVLPMSALVEDRFGSAGLA